MVQIHVRVEDELKEEATKILNEIGMDVTSAIKVFLKQVVLEERIPFDIQLKKCTIDEALDDLANGKTQSFKDIQSLMEDLKN